MSSPSVPSPVPAGTEAGAVASRITFQIGGRIEEDGPALLRGDGCWYTAHGKVEAALVDSVVLAAVGADPEGPEVMTAAAALMARWGDRWGARLDIQGEDPRTVAHVALAAVVSSSPATPEGGRGGLRFEPDLSDNCNCDRGCCEVCCAECPPGCHTNAPPASPAETREGPERAVHYATIWANLAAPWCDPPHLWDWPLAQDPSQVTCPDCIDAAGIEAAASPAVSLPGEAEKRSPCGDNVCANLGCTDACGLPGEQPGGEAPVHGWVYTWRGISCSGCDWIADHDSADPVADFDAHADVPALAGERADEEGQT